MTSRKRDIEQWKVQRIITAVEAGVLDLETEYQRDTIWSREKKVLLIDSILSDIDVPKIYLAYFPSEKRYECIDGKQRIASILAFSSGLLKLENNETFTNLKNKSAFLDYQFTVSILRNPTFPAIVELFYRLNIGKALNGGEMIHAMRGNMRDFIFKTIGEKGPFVGKVGIKAYRFSRETALAQIVMNSRFFTGGKFQRIRYEDIRGFIADPENMKFSATTKKRAEKLKKMLKEVETLFGPELSKLNRKSIILSAYLFCEYMIEKGHLKKDLRKFPAFYIQLIEEMKEQADLHKNMQTPKKRILIDEFQKNLQQASSEPYSIERRHDFLAKAFSYYLKKGEIIGDKK